MWKNYSLAIALICATQILFAQHSEPCASHHYLQKLEEQHPGFAEANNNVFKNARHNGQARGLTLVTIPVVVHIVYQDEEQNLADSIVENVIESLNKDYRRLNEDADQVRSEFSAVAADPFIEFELAAIERVSTTTTFEFDFLEGLPEHVKTTDGGGSDAWDTDHHLNIWVCNIEGGALLGYAYPPADLSHWPDDASAPESHLDGVVIHYGAFNTSGTFTSTGLFGTEEMTIPIRGRTITHEVGHYLGLRHIWGDGTFAIFGIPDCDADDGVEDTPNQGLNSQFQCEESLNTCDDGIDDLPDMFENFMDYSLETCQNTFTEGQVGIMRSVLENERSGLVDAMVASSDIKLNNSRLQIFPNPVSNQLYLKISNEQLPALIQLKLMDMNGRQLKRWLKVNDLRIDVSTLSAGVYYLKANFITGEEVTRFVVN